jgi:hypothetical protein
MVDDAKAEANIKLQKESAILAILAILSASNQQWLG